jgi:hypothetical protein
MSRFISLIIFIGLLGGAVYAHERAKATYDPEIICAKQKDLSREQCLSAINFAMSAGW